MLFRSDELSARADNSSDQCARLKLITVSWRLDRLIQLQTKQTYMGLCNSYLGDSPLMYVPMTTYERSRVLRWKMGWLPGKPKPCRNCNMINTLTSRTHLTTCLRIHVRLQLPIILISPIDYILNTLPTKPVLHHGKKHYWERVWPMVCQLLFEIEQLCLPPDDEVTTDPEFGAPLLQAFITR